MTTLLATAFAAAGCGAGPTPTANNATPVNGKPAVNATPVATAPANRGASPAPADTKAEGLTSQTEPASTPAAAYRAAYAARKNRDTKALRQLISKDMLEFFEIMGEGEGDPVEAGLKQLVENPQGPSDETRNEKINGDKATLEYLDRNGAWKTMDLVREGGSWKLTIDKADKKP